MDQVLVLAGLVALRVVAELVPAGEACSAAREVQFAAFEFKGN
jgi:hypothetical protein